MLDMKILYVCQQITPFIQESTIMADTCRVLPVSLADQGSQIRIFTPRYGLVNERRNQLHEVIRLSGLNLIISENYHQLIIKVASVPNSRQQVYFVDNEDFFKRKAIVRNPETGEFFADNDQRALFFARGVLETVKKLRWEPECIHLHGWMCSFIPAYLKYFYKNDPIFSGTKIILSIYENDSFDETLAPELYSILESEKICQEGEGELLKDPTYENLVKFVLKFCSGVIFVGNISQAIRTYVEQLNIPSQEMEEGDINIEKYTKFYEKVLGK